MIGVAMKSLPLALLFAGLAPAWAGQDQAETRDVRVYLIDRAKPDREFKDAVAVLTVQQESGRGKTFLLPRVAKGTPTPGEDRGTGLIRGVVGTAYFVELQTGDAAPVERREPEAEPAKPAGPTGQEILRNVHRRGVYFSRKIPAELLQSSFTATVTIRLGNLTYTSEEFQGPRTAEVALDEVAARVDQSLATLKSKAEEAAGFMELKPAAGKLIRELSQLAPAGFEDASGEFESDRQWCLALARRIDDACDRADDGRIVDLSQQCRPRLQQMQSTLAGTRKKAEPTPEIPTVK